MSTINRLPRGLQSYFGNTAAGKNPAQLLQDVRPTVDLTPFWNGDSIKYRKEPGSVAATYGVSFIEVPLGESWIPLQLTYELTTSVVGESVKIVCGIADGPALNRLNLADNQPFVTTTAICTHSCQFNFDRISIISGGQQFFGQCNMFDAAGVKTTSLKLRYIRLES